MTDLMADLAAETEASDAPPPQDALEHAQRLGAEVNALDERLERGEALMKELRDRKNQILGRELVDLMDSKQIESFSVAGRTFEVQPYYHASIPKEAQEEGHAWLEANDAGDLIKNEIVVLFPKDSQEEAEALERYVRERYQMAEVERKRSVPWARLTSWLKEIYKMAAEDPEVVLPPLDVIGGTVGRVVKIKEPRKR